MTPHFHCAIRDALQSHFARYAAQVLQMSLHRPSDPHSTSEAISRRKDVMRAFWDIQDQLRAHIKNHKCGC